MQPTEYWPATGRAAPRVRSEPLPGLVSSTQSVWILSGVVCRSKLPDYEQRFVAGEAARQHDQIMIKLSAHVRIIDVTAAGARPAE